MKITLSEAFMLRNDLKKRIQELTPYASSSLWNEKGLPPPFIGGSVHPLDALIEIEALMDRLQALNVAITEANIANNGLLRELETVTARIAVLEQVKRAYASFPGSRVRNRNYMENSPEFIEYDLIGDPVVILETLTAATARKREIEKALTRNNASLTLEA